MAREALAPLEGKRITVQAVYTRTGRVLLGRRPVAKAALFVGMATPDGTLLADHMWITMTRALDALGLRTGALVEMRGTVTSYVRADGTTDYHLSRLRSLQVLDKPPLWPEEDVLLALRMRGSQAQQSAKRANDLLTHVHRATLPAGQYTGGNWLASLLEARGHVWQLGQMVVEMQSLIDRLGARGRETQP